MRLVRRLAVKTASFSSCCTWLFSCRIPDCEEDGSVSEFRLSAQGPDLEELYRNLRSYISYARSQKRSFDQQNHICTDFLSVDD
jgi:hypothetical protein